QLVGASVILHRRRLGTRYDGHQNHREAAYRNDRSHISPYCRRPPAVARFSQTSWHSSIWGHTEREDAGVDQLEAHVYRLADQGRQVTFSLPRHRRIGVIDRERVAVVEAETVVRFLEVPMFAVPGML